MPYTKEEHQEVAQKAARDQFGHFAKKPPTEPTVSTPPIPPTSPKPPTPPQKSSLNDPLVSFSIQNPFKWFFHSLIKILKKQSITVNIPPAVVVPLAITLIAGIPAAFGLGRSVEKSQTAVLPTPTPIIIVKPTATPAPVLVSRMGTIKATYQVENFISPTTPISQITPIVIASDEAKQSLSLTEIPLTPTPVPARYVLEKGETITFLIIPSTINLSYYLNRKVLITGLFDKTKNTLQISKSGDIEVLP